MQKNGAQFWLQRDDGKRWDLRPQNPMETTGGCFADTFQGLGYQNAITKQQINTDYFILETISKNKNITCTFNFINDIHIKNFMEWVGSLDNQLKLFYSPDGSIISSDLISPAWYKPVIITIFDRGEKNSEGMYEVAATIEAQSDVWKKDINIVSSAPDVDTDYHSYPYFYPYLYDNTEARAINITNEGREVGALIKIKNISTSTVIYDPKWVSEFLYKDSYGVEQTVLQEAKFNVSLALNCEIQVDSRETSQRAEIIDAEGNSLNIVPMQEPNYSYINFIRLKHGNNRIIFTTTDSTAIISVYYQLQTEMAY